ncbi:MAG: 1,4-dihydroxy-2-naphthoate octaprenyltransferase [Thermaurantimonas sp.]
MISHWIAAARLRTLPLSVSGILLGTLIARVETQIDWLIFWLSVLTAILFQVLSNFANDLGDALSGADARRVGEARMVASGLISSGAMKVAILVTGFLSLISGVLLVLIALREVPTWIFVFFLLLAASSVWAAVSYTYGAFAYGYRRMGEVFVITFFGFVAVGGSYYLQTKHWNSCVLLPGLSAGMLASAVLNLNNMRDLDTDLASGKRTIANLLGFKGSKFYHIFLVTVPMILTGLFIQFCGYGSYSFLYLLVLPAAIAHCISVLKTSNSKSFDSELKKMALLTLLFVLLLGFGINM